MILTAILTLVIEALSYTLIVVSNLLPEIDTTIIYPYITEFIKIIKVGINGFGFLAGPLPFQLAGTIIALYTAYYFVIMPIKYLLRIIGKGN